MVANEGEIPPDIPIHTSTEPIRVLHVDDDPGITDLTANFLREEPIEFEVRTENNPHDAVDRIETEDIDGVILDYDMPGMNGMELLERIREEYRSLPVILFTGKGSEEVASEAISKGITDYLQKGSSSDQYTVLANRLQNAVSQYRAEQEVERRSEWYSQILEHSSDYVMVVDEMGTVSYISPAVKRVTGYTPEELIGTDSFRNIHPEDLEHAASALAKTIEDAQKEVTVEFRAETADGSIIWLEARGRNFLDDTIINGVMVNVRDITKRKQREQELEAQKNRFQDLTSFLSHDMKNQLNVVQGRIELASTTKNGDHLDKAASATKRMDEMINQARELTYSEQDISELEPVDIIDVVEECKGNVLITHGSELILESSVSFSADRERLQTLLENLLRNAIDHGGSDVTIRIGSLDDGTGFYLEDDGPGIPPEDRDQIFETSYSTSEGGSGLGLAIVKRVVDAHDWTITVAESEDGGARFEVSGVKST